MVGPSHCFRWSNPRLLHHHRPGQAQLLSEVENEVLYSSRKQTFLSMNSFQTSQIQVCPSLYLYMLILFVWTERYLFSVHFHTIHTSRNSQPVFGKVVLPTSAKPSFIILNLVRGFFIIKSYRCSAINFTIQRSVQVLIFCFKCCCGVY